MTDGELNLKELVKSLDWTIAQLQRATSIPVRRMYDTLVKTGNATPEEIQAIAITLGCPVEKIVSVLVETAKRPGEKDARGRSKSAVTVGDQHETSGHGRARNVALDSNGSDEREQPAGDREPLPTEASAGHHQPV